MFFIASGEVEVQVETEADPAYRRLVLRRIRAARRRPAHGRSNSRAADNSPHSRRHGFPRLHRAASRPRRENWKQRRRDGTPLSRMHRSHRQRRRCRTIGCEQFRLAPRAGVPPKVRRELGCGIDIGNRATCHSAVYGSGECGARGEYRLSRCRHHSLWRQYAVHRSPLRQSRH